MTEPQAIEPVNDQTKAAPPAPAEAPIVMLHGKPGMMDHKGRWLPLDTIPEEEQLCDQTVRKIVAFAEDLHAQIGRFKGHTFEDINAFVTLLAEKYGARRGGAKGNITLTSHDGCQKVVLQVQEHMDFGPELQVAKDLIDECLADWGGESRPELQAVVNHAFAVDKPGQVNREAIFSLRQIEIDDHRWHRAVEAINRSIRITGSKAYIRFYRRPTADARWQAITIDLAAAK